MAAVSAATDRGADGAIAGMARAAAHRVAARVPVAAARPARVEIVPGPALGPAVVGATGATDQVVVDQAAVDRAAVDRAAVPGRAAALLEI